MHLMYFCISQHHKLDLTILRTYRCVNVIFYGAHMNIDDSFYKRVAVARTSLGLTQSQLAEAVGVVRRQIAAYEAGNSKPREGVLKNLAATLGTSVEWLSSGNGVGPDVSNIKRTVTVREIPLLSHSQAIRFSLGEASEVSILDFIPAPTTTGEELFALKIDGDSMMATDGISFPDGIIVTFDPKIHATSGSFILCHLNDTGETTFKQLITDQGITYLKPLNPEYPTIKPSDFYIAGVAIHAQFFVPVGRSRPNSRAIAIEALNEKNEITKNKNLNNKINALENKIDTLINLITSGNNAIDTSNRND